MMLREGQTILYVLVCPGYYVVNCGDVKYDVA